MEGTPFGRYRLVELLGRGGMGEVWRAFDTGTKRIVAIKLLPPHLAEDKTFAQRFRREAESAARLDSPHVIPIHDYGEIDGRLYVDMRLIKGRDLQAVLTDGPLEPARGVRIIEQVAKALHAAHEIGLIHRDVKPSNILLDKDDFAYLIDFGIARATEETRLTSGGTIGTFAYIAPERLGDNPDEDARADIYALACVLYECLTGRPPFPGTSAASLLSAHLHTPPPQPSTANPSVPAGFDAVIATGMAKDPNQRYATTVELANAAHDAVTTPIPRPAPTQPTAPPTNQPKPQRRTPPASTLQSSAFGNPLLDPAAPTRQVSRVGYRGPATDTPRQTAVSARKDPITSPASTASSRSAIGVREFVLVLVGVVLLSIAVAICLVPWRGNSLGEDAFPNTLTWLIIASPIPGAGLVMFGRGRAKPGYTVAGYALVAVGLSTLFFDLLEDRSWDPDARVAFVAFGMILAVAGLLLILITMRRRPPTREIARGYLLGGSSILVLAFIDGALLTPGGFWGDGRCSFRFLISLVYEPYFQHRCEVWPGGVLAIGVGALMGLVLLVAGVMAWLSLRRSSA